MSKNFNGVTNVQVPCGKIRKNILLLSNKMCCSLLNSQRMILRLWNWN